MPDSSSPRSPRRLTELLLVVALLGGSAFLWANWKRSHPAQDASLQAFVGSPAQAAPRPRGGPASRKPPMRPSLHVASGAERAAAIQTIRGQLHAFDIGDWKSAVTFQSQGLQGSFSSSDEFGQMIQRSYPAFIRARHVEFGKAMALGPMLQMMVRLTGRDGHVLDAQYFLAKERGQYRIESVRGGASVPSGPPPASDQTPDTGGITV